MSDYYDSLEDEYDENKCSSDSPKKQKTPSADFAMTVSESETTENYSFYLSRNVSEERISILPNFQVSKTPKSNSKKKTFLPEIGSGVDESGEESTRSLLVDKQTLSKQGLQLNNDGSFTKSPRLDTEELPFITQKYRNLQFQRKNAYKTDKKSFKKIQRKNMFSFSKKPVNGISMNEIINARNEKGSSEEMLTSRGSSISVISHSRTDGQLPPNDNLTDSMKEKLLQSQRERSPLKALKTNSNLKKTKRELILIKNCEISRRNKFSHNIKGNVDGEQTKSVVCKERCLKNFSSLNNHKKKNKSTDSEIFKFQSDILKDPIRPKLSYSELRMLKNGYNPLYLRRWNKKVQSDTDRSNFGDSVVEELPEVPNLSSNNENLASGENEEIFYRKLIEMDRNQKQQIQLSTRSESPLEGKKIREENGSSSYKDQAEMRRSEKGNFRRKNISKSISIDLSPGPDYSVNTSQKCSHYCSAEPFRNVSKVELALKAKTYGYLANARNIFRLKAQSGRRSVAIDKGENPKINEKLSSTNIIVTLPQDIDKPSNSLPLNGFLSVEKESFKTLEKLPKATKSFCRTSCTGITRENEEGFVLPPVNNPEIRNNQKKILQRMSCCLKT